MALFRRLFYRKPPDRLLEITDRVYVFDCCFSTKTMEEEEFRTYIDGIILQLQDHFPGSSFMVFNFGQGEGKSLISSLFSPYNITTKDYPQQYSGCPLLPLDTISKFLIMSEAWLTNDSSSQNIMLMHCESGGWPLLAFMLASLLLYRMQYTGEQRTLEMVYKQGPKELLGLLTPLNPTSSHLRYLQYVGKLTSGLERQPQIQNPFTLDCLILRVVPSFDRKDGCRPIVRVYGQDSSGFVDKSSQMLFSTPKTKKYVKHYRKAANAPIKLNVGCRVEGDVMLECIHLDKSLEDEKVMFRVMFSTRFIQSQILALTLDDIDVAWESKDQFSKDFKAEVLFSEFHAESDASGSDNEMDFGEEFFEAEEMLEIPDLHDEQQKDPDSAFFDPYGKNTVEFATPRAEAGSYFPFGRPTRKQASDETVSDDSGMNMGTPIEESSLHEVEQKLEIQQSTVSDVHVARIEINVPLSAFRKLITPQTLSLHPPILLQPILKETTGITSLIENEENDVAHNIKGNSSFLSVATQVPSSSQLEHVSSLPPLLPLLASPPPPTASIQTVPPQPSSSHAKTSSNITVSQPPPVLNPPPPPPPDYFSRHIQPFEGRTVGPPTAPWQQAINCYKDHELLVSNSESNLSLPAPSPPQPKRVDFLATPAPLVSAGGERAPDHLPPLPPHIGGVDCMLHTPLEKTNPPPPTPPPPSSLPSPLSPPRVKIEAGASVLCIENIESSLPPVPSFSEENATTTPPPPPLPLRPRATGVKPPPAPPPPPSPGGYGRVLPLGPASPPLHPPTQKTDIVIPSPPPPPPFIRECSRTSSPVTPLHSPFPSGVHGRAPFPPPPDAFFATQAAAPVPTSLPLSQTHGAASLLSPPFPTGHGKIPPPPPPPHISNATSMLLPRKLSPGVCSGPPPPPPPGISNIPSTSSSFLPSPGECSGPLPPPAPPPPPSLISNAPSTSSSPFLSSSSACSGPPPPPPPPPRISNAPSTSSTFQSSHGACSGPLLLPPPPPPPRISSALSTSSPFQPSPEACSRLSAPSPPPLPPRISNTPISSPFRPPRDTYCELSSPPPPPPPPPPSRSCSGAPLQPPTCNVPPPAPPPPPGVHIRAPPLSSSPMECNGPPMPPPPPPFGGGCGSLPSSLTPPGVSSGPPPPPPPPPPPGGHNSAPPPPPPPRAPASGAPPPPPLPRRQGEAPPPPPPPGGHNGAPLPPPPPRAPAIGAPPPPPMPRGHGGAPPPPAPPGGHTLGNPMPPRTPGAPPPPPSKGANPQASLKGFPGNLISGRGPGLGRSASSARKSSLKPLHWNKVTRVMNGTLWAELQRQASEPQIQEDFDVNELEQLFSAVVSKPNDGSKSEGKQKSAGSKSDKVHLIDLRRANNTEIMLTKIKMPLSDMMNAVLAMDDSILDGDQVENLLKFCPTKEEMETLKTYTGDKENLGKCEQYFLELMKVPRVESKLRVFSFKIQFTSQMTDITKSLQLVGAACDAIRNSEKLKEIMKKILNLGNTMNQGTARGSAVGFRLDSLLKLADTRGKDSKVTLMHYLCKVTATKWPHLMDFHEELASLENASKIQLKVLTEEQESISKGLKRAEGELKASKEDGPVSEIFHKTIEEFVTKSQADVQQMKALYTAVDQSAKDLSVYFGEDPAKCPFEQVMATILNFVRLFRKAHEENLKYAEMEKKKAQKDAEVESPRKKNQPLNSTTCIKI